MLFFMLQIKFPSSVALLLGGWAPDLTLSSLILLHQTAYLCLRPLFIFLLEDCPLLSHRPQALQRRKSWKTCEDDVIFSPWILESNVKVIGSIINIEIEGNESSYSPGIKGVTYNSQPVQRISDEILNFSSLYVEILSCFLFKSYYVIRIFVIS